MATLHVRSVPDDLYELLRERAAANDRSIGAETVQLLYERLVVGAAPPRPFPIPGLRRRPSGPIGTFTRFTADARQAVVAAQAEARTLGHGRVGTEHLLLGVLANAPDLAAALGADADAMRGRLAPGEDDPKGRLPFDPEAKRALELALRESTKLGDTIITPRHILLGIAGAEAGRGAALLRAVEADEAKLRRCILAGAGSPLSPVAATAFFRVVPLEGEAADWETQLNEAAAAGYDLVEIVDRRAVFRR